MDEELMDFDEGTADDAELDYETQIGLQRHDVRRKIEEVLERKRLRKEFGDLSY